MEAAHESKHRADPDQTQRSAELPCGNNPLLTLQRRAGNTAVAHMLRRGLVVQRQAHRHSDVLDNGALTAAYDEVGRRTVRLPQGTYVEVLGYLPDGQLRVRAWPESGQVTIAIPADIFRHEPQIDDVRDPMGGRRSPDRPLRGVRYTDWRHLRLWNPPGPDLRDVSQTLVGDCYLLAVAAALAMSGPHRITALFDGATGAAQNSYTVVLHDPAPGAPDRLRRMTVQASFPVLHRDGRVRSFLGATPGGPQFVLWPAVLEKAIAELMGGYDDLGEAAAGAQDRVETFLTGHPFSVRPSAQWQAMSDADLIDWLERQWRAGVPVIVATDTGRGLPVSAHYLDRRTHIVRNHAYALSGVRPGDQLIELHNPHGTDQPRALTPDQFRRFVVEIRSGR